MVLVYFLKEKKFQQLCYSCKKLSNKKQNMQSVQRRFVVWIFNLKTRILNYLIYKWRKKLVKINWESGLIPRTNIYKLLWKLSNICLRFLFYYIKSAIKWFTHLSSNHSWKSIFNFNQERFAKDYFGTNSFFLQQKLKYSFCKWPLKIKF